MNYHDTRFARRLGETPIRPDYANAIERFAVRGHRAAYWTMALAVVYLAVLLIWELV